MATVSALVGGTEYDLSSLYDYRGHDGLGMANLHRLKSRGPQQHGDSDRGFQLDPRVFRVFIGLDGESISDLYDKRAALLRLFKPMNAALALRWYLDNGETWQIDAHYVSDMGMPSAQRQGYYQDVIISLKAPVPTFYDPVQESVTFALSVASAGFTIPLPIPWPIGASTMDQVKTVYYAGTFLSFPVVKIVGPITDAKIESYTTDEKLDFQGYTINAGDYYEIDCRDRYKTVVDSNGTNKIAELSTDSDLVTFHLEPAADGGLTRGNDFVVTGTGVTTATEVYLRYYTRFVGL